MSLKRQREEELARHAAPEFLDEHEASGAAMPTGRAAWPRPPSGRDASKPLAFMWFDIDMYSGKPLTAHPRAGARLPGARDGPVPIIRVFGVTQDGHSVMAHIHGVSPYFYVKAPPGFAPSGLLRFQAALEQQLAASARGERCRKYVLACELVVKQSLLGYHFERMDQFIKITVAMPTLVPTGRRIVENGFSFDGSGTRQYQCFEANMPFVLRFMIDRNIVGCNWLELPGGAYTMRRPDAHVSRCQLEVDVVFEDIVSHDTTGVHMGIAPVRILSFDIECQGRRGHFPEPEKDPVIQIANIVTLQGAPKSFVRNVFVLDTCKPIAGAEVLSFPDEASLLAAWAAFVREVDPDILTGYNIADFDIPYLLRRANHLKVADFDYWGRIKASRARMRESTFSSAAFGTRTSIETTVEGRVIFDVIQFMRRNYKLSSYTLNAVSVEFLGQQKEDVHHSIISDLQRGSDEDRRRLAVYCLKDAYLPQRLLDKLMAIINNVEMARVTGVPLQFLLQRGQQIKVLSMLYRKAQQHDLLIPTLSKGPSNTGQTYEGATVIEPKRGYYTEPIATLDFASLYPSIMMAHNLCYSTLLAPEDVRKLPEGQVQRTPCGNFFVKKGVKQGILPVILEELLAARKRAKADMKKATDPMVKAVQNGRQLALKVSANSVYGFTGATVGQLPCLAISSSVTAFGREMIEQTKEAVERLYTVDNGYETNATVVYGDTDSVMIKFGTATVAASMELGEKAAKEVTALFPPPVKLEFEKVYKPYLLMNKKRYAGLLWTKPDRWDKLDAKGIETVRRDNCLLVRRVVGTCLDRILKHEDVKGAIDFTKGVISDLLQNKLDISLLVITKALGKDNYDAKMPHVELAKRMRKRDPGSAPVTGDRVPYVIVPGAKDSPAYMRSEDPVYVLENGLSIDANYYLHNQLSKPLVRIFEPIIENTSSLFHGDHTRVIAKPTPKGGRGIMQFAVRSLKCMSCKTPLPKGRKTVCKHCEEKEGQVYHRALTQVNDLENKFSRLWTQCQRCQGSLHQDVLCTNRDCPIFYMRKKVQKDLDGALDTLSRFDEW